MTGPTLDPRATGALRLEGTLGDTSRLANADNLKAAGERFEAIFVGMMLNAMRDASLGEGLFDSKAVQQFRDMQDQRLSEVMAETAPIGIGKAMTEFLSRSQPTLIADDDGGAATP